jgi:glutathione peroxidase
MYVARLRVPYLCADLVRDDQKPHVSFGKLRILSNALTDLARRRRLQDCHAAPELVGPGPCASIRAEGAVMTKRLCLSIFILAFGAFMSAQQPASFYDLQTQSLDGKPGNLAQYRGKVSLVVNVASKCGYTPQYEGLEQLQRELKGKGFNVLGFPSNDFGGQEPGSAKEIADFCRLTYDVTFPMFEKVVTKKGVGQSPIYGFLGRSGNLPAWNFSKYLIDKQGRIVGFFPSEVTPEDASLRAAIMKAIAAS